MNELLVAVDFSESSLNALEHAFGIAERFKMHMVLAWVETKNSLKFLEIPEGESVTDHVSKLFEDLKRKYHPRLNGKDFEYKLLQGVAYTEIVNLAHNLQVDFLVTGSHGVHGYKQMFIGNNANNIIEKSKVPVISIQPNRKESTALKVIVAPIDSTMDTRQKIPFVAAFAQKFHAEVHIVGIYTSGINTHVRRVDDYVGQTIKYMESLHVKVIRHSIKTDSPAKSILEYVSKVDANLVSVMVEQESMTSDLWLGTQCAQLVNQCPVPVLTVPNKEYVKSVAGL